MFTITDLGVTGELARCLATTNVIESPNSVVRRVSGRVTSYKDADLKVLLNRLRPVKQQLKKAA